MAQTRNGAILVAAQRTGCTPDEYRERVDRGEKWCTYCRDWHVVASFGSDTSRSDGLSSICRLARARIYAEKYRRKCFCPIQRGRSFVPARDGDKRQARRRINFFVEQGIIPNPNDIPCVDCGHIYEEGGRRHEYDHHMGYLAEFHETVEAVCSTCHRQRAIRRGEWQRKPRSNG